MLTVIVALQLKQLLLWPRFSQWKTGRGFFSSARVSHA
jgi:hypothetical protein